MKKLITIIAFLLIGTNAQANWTNEHEITDFSKMLSSHINPFIIGQDGAVEARNLRSNIKFGELSKRNAMDLYGSIGAYKVTGMHRYYKTNGDQLTVASGGTLLLTDFNNDKNFITIRDELTDGRRWTFITYKNQVIGANGIDPVQKYDGYSQTTADTDGSRTAGILTADLGAPYAELNTGSNLDASSWYQYRVAFYNGSVYSFSTARSNPILTGGTVRDISLTDIPLGPPGTTHRYIYRTDGNASRTAVEADTTFRLVGTISNNSATTFNDTTADGSSATPSWATVSAGVDLTPPIAKFILLHKERIFLANNPTHTSDIYWSFPFRADIFSTESYEPIREDDGDDITCLKNQSGVIVVCKTNTISKLITLSADTDQWQVLGPYSHVGCQAPYSAVNTPKGIAFLSKEGVYIFDGSNSQLISDIVTTDVSDILWSSRQEAVGVYFKNEYQLAYTSESSGEADNNRVLVFDMQRDAYSIDDKNVNVFEIFQSGTDEGTLYSGSSLTDGKILAHTQSSGNLIYKKKSELSAGTFDDSNVFGSEQDPYIQIAWTGTFGSPEFAGKGFDHVDYSTSTFARPDLDGTWQSPIVEVNATSFDKLYWNEDLGPYGDITFALRVGGTLGEIEAASYSSEVTNPTGSDVSGVAGDKYVQIRASLATSDINFSPKLVRINNFVARLIYNREGNDTEDVIATTYRTGYMNFGVPDLRKRLWEISVYYEGTEGTMIFNVSDVDGVVNKTFSIDLSVNPNDSATDGYEGTALGKKFTYTFPYDGTLPISEFYQYTLNENGATPWQVKKIKTRYSIEKTY